MDKIIRFDNWCSKSPFENIAPSFVKREDNNDLTLELSTVDSYYTYGEWYSETTGICENTVYNFSVSYDKGGADCRAYAILTWLDHSGKLISRDYAKNCEEHGIRKLERIISSPEGAAELRLELCLNCKGSGYIRYHHIHFSQVGEYVSRNVTLATTYIEYSGERTFDKNMSDILRVIHKAAQCNPDIIVLTEGVYARRIVGLTIDEKSITIPGGIYNQIAEMAKQYNTYLAFSVHEKENGYYYNTAVLIDRQGKLVGKYRKTHLTMEEIEIGIVPGDAISVFETDFGKVGLLVCWDHWYPEAARLLYLQGAEVICIPTAGFIDCQSRARALDNSLYVVTSCLGKPEYSRIIDKKGEVIAAVIEDYTAVTVDINQRYYQHWLSVGDGWGESSSLYRQERRPILYDRLCNY